MVRPKHAKQSGAGLDVVRTALAAFDVNAVVGTYCVDDAIIKIGNRRKLPPNPHHVIRRQIYSAGRSAIEWEHHKTVSHPRNETAAREFFEKIREFKTLDEQIQAFNVERISNVTHRESLDDLVHPDLGEQIQKVEDDIAEIRESARKTSTLIDRFLAVTSVPEFVSDSSRTVLFTHHFIDSFALDWTKIFGVAPSTSDLHDMTILIATGLRDLKYPLSRSQLDSDVWLSDRIRKQIFRN